MLCRYEKLLVKTTSLSFWYLPPVPIQWNLIRSTLHYTSYPTRAWKHWLIACSLSFLFAISCIVSIILKHVFHLPRNLTVDFIQLYLGCYGLMTCSYLLIFYNAGSEPLQGLNKTIDFNQKLRQYSLNHQNTINLFDIVVISTSPYGSSMTPILVLGFLYFKLDPLYTILGSTNILCLFIRTVISFSLIVIVQTFCTTFTTLHIWLRKYESILNILVQTENIFKNVYLFRRVRLLTNFIMPTIENLCSVTLTTISLLIVFMFWIGVKGQASVHYLVHLVVASSAVIHAIGLVLFLCKLSSLGKKCTENLTKIRTNARILKTGWRGFYIKKYLMRQTASISPIYFWVRPFMPVTMDTSLSIYLFVSTRIADALIVL